MTIESRARHHLAGLLETRTGQQIAPGRIWRIEITLRPLMLEQGFASLDDLVAALMRDTDPTLADHVVEALLNHETSFFRDHALFKQLETGGIERLRAIRNGRLRIWSAGCSTGQEAYSLAMLFADAVARWEGWNIEIHATDVSGAAISRAREGRYSRFEIQRGLPVNNMLRWFDQEGDNWQVKPDLPRRISFQRHNLLEAVASTPPFDIILCRNVMLYFSPERRQSAFERLAAAIAPDGCLMLGAGETILGLTDTFVPDSDNRGLYRATTVARHTHAA